MIDEEGFRHNVGIIVTNGSGRLLWARRYGTQNAWQFPQGGIGKDESAIAAMYRELKEELGLNAQDVELLAESKQWYEYRLPKRFQRRDDKQRCIGQRQKWFLLRLKSDDNAVKLDDSESPEFDRWRWVSYWFPLRQVIFFKRSVYKKVLQEFALVVFR